MLLDIYIFNMDICTQLNNTAPVLSLYVAVVVHLHIKGTTAAVRTAFTESIAIKDVLR